MKKTFENGWYSLKTESGEKLYRADESLVADNLYSCTVYEDGYYVLEMPDDDLERYYKPDGTLVRTELNVNRRIQ